MGTNWCEGNFNINPGCFCVCVEGGGRGGEGGAQPSCTCMTRFWKHNTHITHRNSRSTVKILHILKISEVLLNNGIECPTQIKPIVQTYIPTNRTYREYSFFDVENWDLIQLSHHVLKWAKLKTNKEKCCLKLLLC